MEYIIERLTSEELVGTICLIVGFIIGVIASRTYFKELIHFHYKPR